MIIHLVIRGRPVSSTNSRRIVSNRRTGRPFTIKSKAYAAWSASAISQLTDAHPLHGQKAVCVTPTAITLRVYRAADVGDLDNFAKGVLDALQQSNWLEDDKLVVQLEMFKLLDRKNPRIEIEITAPRSIARTA